MDLRSFNPFIILFLEGLFGLIISIISIIAFEYICGNDLSIFRQLCSTKLDLKNLSMIHLYFAMIYIVIVGILNGCKFMTNKHFSPSHLIIAELLSAFIQWIVTCISKKQLEYLPLIGYCIMLTGVLVYNEIIIFHFCKLDFYTRIEIQIRSNEEIDFINESLLLDLSNDDI